RARQRRSAPPPAARARRVLGLAGHGAAPDRVLRRSAQQRAREPETRTATPGVAVTRGTEFLGSLHSPSPTRGDFFTRVARAKALDNIPILLIKVVVRSQPAGRISASLLFRRKHPRCEYASRRWARCACCRVYIHHLCAGSHPTSSHCGRRRSCSLPS